MKATGSKTRLLDTAEASRRLGISPHAVRIRVRRGRLKAWRVGGGKWSRYRFRWQDLKYAKKRLNPSAPPGV